MDIFDILEKRNAPRGIRSDLTYREVRELGNWENQEVEDNE
jgi:hypothetical protein